MARKTHRPLEGLRSKIAEADAIRRKAASMLRETRVGAKNRVVPRYTWQEIAAACGVSIATLRNYGLRR